MKHIFTVLLSVCLIAVLFAGCGGNAVNYEISDISDAILPVAKVENPLEISADDLIYEFNIPAENAAEFTGVKTGVANAAGTVLVIKAAEGKIEDIKASLEGYKNGLVAVSENYQSDFPEAFKQVSDGRIVVKGDYAVLAIAAAGVDYADIDAAIESSMK